MAEHTAAPATTPASLAEVAESFAAQATRFLETSTQVASGAAPEAAIPLLLLATTDILAAGGHTEIVLVPLQITHAVDCDPAMSELLHRARTAYPDQRFTLSRPIGPEMEMAAIT